jgi:anti-sigma factor RsiW
VTRGIDERLSALLDAELEPAERDALEAELRARPETSAQLEALRALERALTDLPRLEPRPGFETRFRARLAGELAREWPPWWRRAGEPFAARGVWLGAGATAAAAAALFLALWPGSPQRPDAELEFIALLEDPDTLELLRSEDVELLEVLEILEAWDDVREG